MKSTATLSRTLTFGEAFTASTILGAVAGEGGCVEAIAVVTVWRETEREGEGKQDYRQRKYSGDNFFLSVGIIPRAQMQVSDALSIRAREKKEKHR